MTTTTYQLETLTCQSCVAKIEGALGSQAGVKDTKVLFNSSKVKVEHDETADTKDMKELIEKLGYEVLSEK